MFSEIEGAIRKRQGHLIEGRLVETGAHRLTGFFTIQLADAEDLKIVTKNIRSIPGIIGIQMVN
jgi:GTP pyrophosphokinase